MDILGLIKELDALEELDKARKALEQGIASGVTMHFPDPPYEEAVKKLIEVFKENRGSL